MRHHRTYDNLYGKINGLPLPAWDKFRLTRELAVASGGHPDLLPSELAERWFNRKEVTEMGKKENKKDKGQSDQKKSPPTDSSMRIIGQKRKR
jgi:hypothetical protein